MTLSRLTLVFALASATTAACSVEPVSGERQTADAGERGIGKADGVWGSCAAPAGAAADSCGAQAAEGNCWCDELCTDYGDCCGDKADVCGGDDNVDPTPKLCLGDNSCDEGETCDHSECLSGCTGNAICPAVCFGQCVGGDDDGGDDAGDDGDDGDDDGDDPNCSSKTEKDCEASDDCTWTTTPGFPGPISMCVEAEEVCDVNPLTVFCSDGTFFSVEECACVPIGDDDGTPDCEPDDSYTAVTGPELAADPSAFVGERIWLTGEAKVGFPICTQLACGPQNPCCNSCGAGITMDLGSTEIEMSGIGCGGNNCEVMNNCEYGAGEGFTAWGTLTETFGTLFLEIDDHCGA